MYLHFIYNEKKWSENIDEYESCGRLTYNVAKKIDKNFNDIFLMDETKSKILDPSDPILFMGEKSSEIRINVMDRQKGGGGFFWSFLKVIFLIFIYQFIMVSGIFPMFSKLYTTFIDYILDGFKRGVQYLFKTKKSFIIYLVDGLVFVLKFILQIFSTYFFVYGFTAYMAIAILKVLYPREYCDALLKGTFIAKICTTIYITFYIILNIINWIFYYSGEAVKNIPVVGIVIEPGFMKLNQSFDKMKLLPFMLMPYVGKMLKFYFNGVDVGMNKVQIFDNYLKKIIEDPTNISAILKQYPDLALAIKNNKMERLFNYIQIAYLPPEELKKQNITSSQLITAKLAKNVFLGLVGFFSLFNQMIDDQGGVFELGNIIKTGAISGAMGVLAFTIILIYYFIRFFFF